MRTFFNSLDSIEEWWLFHDESGTFGCNEDRWVVIGILFVAKNF